MSDLYDRPPDGDEMAEVVKAMMEAWKSGADYIADSKEFYFRYAAPVMKINGAVRIGGGESKLTADGREFMMDTYRSSNGKLIRMGYELNDDS